MKINQSLLKLMDDLTDKQICRLVYYCLGCDSPETARRRGVSKQTVHQTLQTVIKKRTHQEQITALQNIFHKRGFML